MDCTNTSDPASIPLPKSMMKSAKLRLGDDADELGDEEESDDDGNEEDEDEDDEDYYESAEEEEDFPEGAEDFDWDKRTEAAGEVLVAQADGVVEPVHKEAQNTEQDTNQTVRNFFH